MGKFVLTYQGGIAPTTPEEGEKTMAAWMSWFGTLGAAVADGGNPFGASTTIASDGAVGSAGAAGLTGYSILHADSLDAAINLAKGCPHLAAGGTVDVYEAMDVG
jgi:hypothetical protein